MSHEIFNEKFYSYRTVPWHRIGTVSETLESPSQVFEKIQYTVKEFPIFYYDEIGNPHPILNKKVLVSFDETEQNILDVVNAKTDYPEPRKIIELLESLGLPIETMGALKKGKILFATFKLDPFSVVKDRYENYILISAGWGGAYNALWTPVRTVCMNTFRLAMRKAQIVVKVTHRTKNAEILFLQQLNKLINTSLEKIFTMQQKLEQSYHSSVNSDEAKECLGQIYPQYNLDLVPEHRREAYQAINETHRNITELVMQLFGGKMTGHNGEKTRYNLLQAVVEYENFGNLKKDPAMSLLFGERGATIQKAMEVILK